MLKVKLKIESEVYATLCAVVVLGAFVVFAFYIAPLPLYSPARQQTEGQAVDTGDHRPKSDAPSGAIQKTAEDRIADYTWWVGAFTLALAVVSSLQIFFLIRADRTARITAEAAQKSARAAEDAVSIATERPWLFVSGVFQLTSQSPESGDWDPLVRYDVVNHGKAPAIVENVMAGFSVGSWPPQMPMRADENNSLFVSPILGPDETRKDIPASLPNGVDCSFKQAEIKAGIGQIVATGAMNASGLMEWAEFGTAIPKLSNGEELYFWVIVVYRGPLTKGHQTSACWVWHQGEGYFVHVGHEEYNYTR